MTSPAADTSITAGARFGRYELVSRIHSGEVSEVWTAACTGASQGEPPVALKALRAHLSSHPLHREQLAREIALHSRVDHRNIVRCVGSGGALDAVEWLALEYVQARSLRELIDAVGPGGLSLATALRVVAGVCDALAYLHELPGSEGGRGVVHCDVRPENVLVESAESVKLIDLGSASPPRDLARSDAPAAARAMPRVGRLQYRAPELVQHGAFDGRSDVYSVGMVLFEITRGLEIAHGAQAVDPEVATLVADATRVDPAERVPTARDLAARAIAAATRLDGGRVAPLPSAADWDDEPDTLRPPAGTELDRRVHALLHAMRSSDALVAAGEFERGWRALRSGSPAEALQAWEEALALDPYNRTYALDVRQLRRQLLRGS